MQLPGMNTEPVRVALEVTWWPGDGTWSVSRRDWRRDHDNMWRLEAMSTSGTPLSREEMVQALDQAVEVVCRESRETDDPFSAIGSFR